MLDRTGIDAPLERRADGDMRRMWLIGCGAMGGTLLGRWIAAAPLPLDVTVVDPDPRGLPDGFAGSLAADCEAAAAGPGYPDIVVLGVKPQQVVDLSARLAPILTRPVLLMSMLAGVRAATLAMLFPCARIVRMMPNTPARIGQGITALYGHQLEPGDAELASRLLEPAGRTLWLDDEARFDAVTAVSGSGPAFLFRFIEALAGAGEAVGLDPAVAALLALETVTGAAALAARAGQTPAQLRQQVTSPNGVTQAGLDVLDGDGALSTLLRSTVRTAAERSRALAAAVDSATDTGAQPVRGQ